MKKSDPLEVYTLGKEIISTPLSTVYTVEKRPEMRGSFGPTCVKVFTIQKVIDLMMAAEHIRDYTKETVMQQVNAEISIFRKMSKCEYVPNFIDCYEWDGKLWTFTEHCKVGDLPDVYSKISVTKDDQRSIMFCMLQGLKYMHERGYAHCDIKTDNVLIHHNGTAMLCDFGGAVKCDKAGFHEGTFVGPRNYLAPEVLLGLFGRGPEYGKPTYHLKRDIWACGVVDLILEDGRSPMYRMLDYTPEAMYIAITTGQGAGLWEGQDPLQFKFAFSIAEDRIDFMKTMLTLDYKARPTAAEMLQHEYFEGARSKQFHQQQLQDLVRRFNNKKS